jgi:hypothetical protein
MKRIFPRSSKKKGLTCVSQSRPGGGLHEGELGFGSPCLDPGLHAQLREGVVCTPWCTTAPIHRRHGRPASRTTQERGRADGNGAAAPQPRGLLPLDRERREGGWERGGSSTTVRTPSSRSRAAGCLGVGGGVGGEDVVRSGGGGEDGAGWRRRNESGLG